MKSINEMNITLNKMATNISLANDIRKATVQDVINTCLEFAKNNKEVFTDKKTAISVFLKGQLTEGAKADTYTKRAVKIAKVILVDKYNFRKELLSLSQMEQLSKFKKETVNALMTIEEEFYIEEVKELINSAKVTKNTKIFNSTKASKI